MQRQQGLCARPISRSIGQYEMPADGTTTMSRNWQAISVMPTLGVPDLGAASEYYQRLGFEESWRYPEDEEATNLGMCLGEVSLMFWRCPQSDNRQNLYFIVKNVSGFHAQVAEALETVNPLVESDYGMRDFSITDPWGHLLTFGESLEPAG